MSDRTITEDNLGAWLIKCDPESKFDLPRAIEQGWTYIDNWSVSRGYRSSMMRPEHKVILWVSGNGRRMARGIWGLGWVEGFVHDTIPEELEEDEDSFWHSEEDRLAVTNDIAVFIPLFLQPVTAEQIVAAGITDLEVQVQAAMSNPSWVSKEQMQQLEPVLGEWPEYEEPDVEITLTTHGAGFGTPEQNRAVEVGAMDAVVDFYGEDWRHKDVKRRQGRLGPDLYAQADTGSRKDRGEGRQRRPTRRTADRQRDQGGRRGARLDTRCGHASTQHPTSH